MCRNFKNAKKTSFIFFLLVTYVNLKIVLVLASITKWMVVEENGKSAPRTKRFPMQISDTLGGKLASKVTDETVSSIEARLHDYKPGSTKVAGKDFQFLKLEVFTVYWDLSIPRFISCIRFLFPTYRTSGFANVLRRLLNEKVQKCWRITSSTRSRSKLLYHRFDEKFDHEINLYFHHFYFSFNSVLCYSYLFCICKRICYAYINVSTSRTVSLKLFDYSFNSFEIQLK